MMWLVLGVLVCLARLGEGGALRCAPGVQDPTCIAELEEGPEPELKQGRSCEPGTSWKSQCNDCACSPDGLPFCTDKACLALDSEPEKQCAPESRWKNECNRCFCTPNGIPSCTRKGCLSLAAAPVPYGPQTEEVPESNTSVSRKKRGVTQEAAKACQPGQEFRMDCNKCLCDNLGQNFSCTRIDCNALNNNNGGVRTKRETSEKKEMECSPGSVFDRDCNVCRCSDDGHHATCTTKRCSIPTTQDNDVNSPVAESDPNFRCSPGEQFKRGCNDCSCSADGKSVFCTVRFCDQDITPPPSH